MIYHVDAWHTSLRKRLVKSPKLFFYDTALLSHLLQIDLHTLEHAHPMFGHIFENFVASELTKLVHVQGYKIYHYRDSNHTEVDFVLENQKGERIGIKVKGSTRLQAQDTRNLKSLRATAPLTAGYIIHPGKDFYALGEHDYALPISFFETLN